MAPVTTAKYLFVLSTGSQQSQKELELQDANARAHAARQSHVRRKNAKHLVTQNGTNLARETSSEKEEKEASSSAASTPQPVLWRKVWPRRRTIFAHQSYSRKQNPKQGNLAWRRSAAGPGLKLTETSKPLTDISQPRGRSVLRVEGGNCPWADVNEYERLHEEKVGIMMAAQAHPTSILGKGNSDPFQAFAIPIDARVADLLAYSREMYLPEIFSHVSAPDVRAAVLRAFDESITFLHDECTAYPSIAKIAAVMPKTSAAPELLSQIPLFKTKGLALLRKRLMDPASLLDSRTSASMLLYLTAELYEGNLEAASFHAGMIAHLLQTRIMPLDFLFLFSALYDDTQRASFTLSRPAFDMTWVAKKVGLTMPEKLPGRIIAEACGPVDASIKSPRMREILTEANHCTAIALLMSKDRIYTDNQTTYRFGCRRLACIGTIINHYIDSRNQIKQATRNDPDISPDARMEAQVCLALLYLMRREAKMDTFWIGAKFAVFSENHNILLGLQDFLRQDMWDKEGRYARVKLFALFVGAWAAHANTRARASYALVEREWFNAEFAAQMAMMGLRSWNAVHEVLVGFHFLDFLLPDGSIFWKTMSP